MNAEIYVHEVVGVPGSDVGHLPAPWGIMGRRTLCGGDAIERALSRIAEANEELWREDWRAEGVSWWVEPEGRRPCRRCVREADAEHQKRLDQIRAMGGRP